MSAQSKTIWTVVDIIRWGTEYFSSKGVDSPRLTIELLLSDMLNCSRLQLYLMYDRPLTEAELSILRTTCTRRAKREPLQYILGKSSFYGLEFELSPAVLIPRPETETLIDIILKHCNGLPDPIRITDIGTGSGCIAITLAHHLRHRKDLSIIAQDISKDALDIAQKNAQLHNVKVQFEQADLFEYSEKIEGIIVSNPPYISTEDYFQLEPELFFEPRVALTDESDGLRFYKKIAQKIIDGNGEVSSFFLEIGYGQVKDVENLFTSVTSNLQVVKDLSGIERVLWGIVDL